MEGWGRVVGVVENRGGGGGGGGAENKGAEGYIQW